MSRNLNSGWKRQGKYQSNFSVFIKIYFSSFKVKFLINKTKDKPVYWLNVQANKPGGVFPMAATCNCNFWEKILWSYSPMQNYIFLNVFFKEIWIDYKTVFE